MYRHILSTQELYEEKISKKGDIIDYLENGYVRFVYFKENGDKRIAFGTLKKDFIDKNFEYSDAPKNDKSRNGEKAADKMGFIKYYDLVKHGWRMFKVSNKVFYKESFDTIDELEDAYPKLKGKLDRYKLPKSEAEARDDDDESENE